MDDPNSAPPWASVFDSAANMRALTAIQAEGLRAASELVDRFVRFAATGLGSGRPRTGAAAQDERADLYGATDLAPLLRSWLPMLGVHPPASPSRPTRDVPEAGMDLGRGQATGSVLVQLAAPGIAAAEVWLHNSGTKDLGDVAVRCGPLTADDGTTLDADAVAFDPGVVPLPPRSSRGVAVNVELTADIPTGVYRALILVAGHPQLCLPLVLTVGTASP